MKKIFNLLFITGIALLFGFNNTKALQENYELVLGRSITYPNELKGDTGKISYTVNYNKVSYQWHSMTESNYTKLENYVNKHKTYQENYDNQMKNKNTEIAAACNVTTEQAKYCISGMGGPSCIGFDFDLETASNECKTAVSKYETLEENSILESDEYKKNIYNILPNIDDNKWIVMNNNTFKFDSSLATRQILYTKAETNDVAFYDFITYKFATKVTTTTKDKTGLTTTTKGEEVVGKGKIKEDKTTEKNPKTGINNYLVYGLILIIVSLIGYKLVNKKRIFER